MNAVGIQDPGDGFVVNAVVSGVGGVRATRVCAVDSASGNSVPDSVCRDCAPRDSAPIDSVPRDCARRDSAPVDSAALVLLPYCAQIDRYCNPGDGFVVNAVVSGVGGVCATQVCAVDSASGNSVPDGTAGS